MAVEAPWRLCPHLHACDAGTGVTFLSQGASMGGGGIWRCTWWSTRCPAGQSIRRRQAGMCWGCLEGWYTWVRLCQPDFGSSAVASCCPAGPAKVSAQTSAIWSGLIVGEWCRRVRGHGTVGRAGRQLTRGTRAHIRMEYCTEH